MFCKNCGKQLPDGAAFCPACGAQQTAQAAAQPTAPAAGAAVTRPRKKKSLLGRLLLVLLVLVGIFLMMGLLFGEDATYTSTGSTGDDVGGSAQVLQTGAGIYGRDLTDVAFRAPYTTVKGGGADTWTIMVYMVGADLESDGGCATADINEMLEASGSDKVNVVMQTGGCSYWQNGTMSDGEVQRWHIQDGGIEELANLGTQSMLTSKDLSDFLGFAQEEYPADRYALIFWDHGGGSVYGFGSDEMFPDDVLYLPDIEQALKATDIKYDFVGFDACLMGSMETAYMLEPFADYLIGSEELEPGYGWYYTEWLSALAQDTSMDTVTLGTHIVDSFIEDNSASDTLSVISLREVPYVYEKLGAFMDNASGQLSGSSFRTLSSARANTKAFAADDGSFDMIDLVDFVNRTQDIEGAQELLDAVNSAVKYRNNCTSSGVGGMSMYFPYAELGVYGHAKDFFSEFGLGGACYNFYDNFVNILAGGQSRSNGQSLAEKLTGETQQTTDYSGESWYDPEQANTTAADDGIDYTELTITQQGEDWILPLTDADWERLTSIELQVLLDDGEGYIDLGSDQTFNTDEEGNLLIDFNNTWVAIDGQVVPYYAESTVENTDESFSFTGTVPAELTREGETQDIVLVLKWDTGGSDGYVAGWRYAEGNSTLGTGGTVGRGLNEFKKGDAVQFYCDYYTYDGDYEASYYLGDTLTVGDKDMTVTYEDVGEAPVLVSFMLTDIYQNQSWTETVEMS